MVNFPCYRCIPSHGSCLNNLVIMRTAIWMSESAHYVYGLVVQPASHVLNPVLESYLRLEDAHTRVPAATMARAAAPCGCTMTQQGSAMCVGWRHTSRMLAIMMVPRLVLSRSCQRWVLKLPSHGKAVQY